MKNKRVKIWTRNYNLNFMAVVVRALNSESLKFLSRSFSNTLGQGIYGKTSFWMGEEDKKKFDQKVKGLFIKDWRSFKKYLNLYQKYKEKFHKICRKIYSTNLKNVSNSSLAELYQNFEETNSEFMLIGQWTAFYLIEMIPGILEQRLIKEEIEQKQIEKIVSIVLSSFKTKAVAKMEEELLRIVHKFKNKKASENKEKQIIEKLVKKYGWIPSMVVDATLWDEKFFKARIKELTQKPNLEDLLQKSQDLKKETKKKKRDFNNFLIQYPKLKDLFKIANKLTDLKDERDEARRFAYFLVRPLFYEIACRTKLKIDELLTLSPSEILSFLLKSTLPFSREINQRKKNFIIYISNKKFKIYSGKQAVAFTKKHLREKEELGQKDFPGISASKGRAKGKARIVLDKRDLLKIRQEDILVAITTHPDYLLAMKRVKAIITDEGGLTSHAAIVSRELNIPCIVGTKIATKVLKDGDLVEVDADKGIIKILKN